MHPLKASATMEKEERRPGENLVVFLLGCALVCPLIYIYTYNKGIELYHRFAKMLHSDNGGSDEEMKILNAEYAELFGKVKDIHTTKDGEDHFIDCLELRTGLSRAPLGPS